MEIAALALCFGIVFFLCLYLGFRSGLRLGMRAAKGVEPAPLRSPVRVIKETREAKAAEKAADEFEKQLEELENYDGYTAEERKVINRGKENA